MPRIYIETYGCQMNVSDSELMFGVLGREGYVRTDDPAQADVLLVNTCAVRDHAEQKVRSRLGELKQYKRRGDVLGVVGCMAQRLGARLLERVPQVDLVIGPDGYRGLPELIARARAGERAAEVEFKSWEHYEDVPPVRGTPVSAFVTVQRGCDYRCTFCIVPMTRGPERSRKLDDVVREVERLTAGGTRGSRSLARRSTATQTASTTSRICCARSAACRAWRGCASPRHTPPTSATACSAPWPRRLRSASTCTCRCRAAARACSGGCCGATTAPAISRSSPHCGTRCRGSRSRPTSSSASRVRRRAISRRRSRWSRKWASTTPSPSSTRRARGRRRPASRASFPTRWRASGWGGSSPRCAAWRVTRTSASSARRTKCSSKPRRSAATCCRGAPAPTRWRCSKGPTGGSARTPACGSPARPARRSRRAWSSRRLPVWGDERDVGGGASGLREAARPVPAVLRLRHVSRRRARVRAQPAGAALCVHPPGRSAHRAELGL